MFKLTHRRYKYPPPPKRMRGCRKYVPFYTSRTWWDWWSSLGPQQRDQYIRDTGEYRD